MAGTYQLLSKGKARLQYMYKGERYSKTIDAKTDKQASIELAKFVTQIQNNQISNSSMTYLVFAQKWLDEYVRPNLSPIVAEIYKNYLNKRILPYFGPKKLKDIDTAFLRKFFNEMKTWKTDYKPPRKNIPISKETYRKIYDIISGTLQRAFEWDIIPSNPCRKFPLSTLRLDRLPSEIEKRKKKQLNQLKIRAYTKETYQKVIKLLDNNNNINDKYRPQKLCTEFILKTGLCLSEVAGLMWKRDWDKENRTITVNIDRIYIKHQGWIEKEPKETYRARTITLSESLNDMLIAFRKENPKNKYIFSELINFNSFTSWLKKWEIENNIIPVLTTHELRHTHATLLLKEKVPVKYISKRLGHANTGVTENTYIEYLKEDDIEVADIIDKI